MMKPRPKKPPCSRAFMHFDNEVYEFMDYHFVLSFVVVLFSRNQLHGFLDHGKVNWRSTPERTEKRNIQIIRFRDGQ